MSLSVDGIAMPQSVLHLVVIDGVREIRNYDPHADTFIGRWDTMINGKQYHHIDYQPTGISTDDWMQSARLIAMNKFHYLDNLSTNIDEVI